VDWSDRSLVFQWHRGDTPERYRSFALRSQDWKLVQPLGSGEHWGGKTDFQLFDMAHDSLEMQDLAAEHPERVKELKAAYDAWYNDVNGSRDFGAPQRIFVGSEYENPVLLTRQDWRGPKANWSLDGIGYWDLNVVTSGRYDIKVKFNAAKADGEARLTCASISARQPIGTGTEECVFTNMQLPGGPARLEATSQHGTNTLGASYVEVRRLD
jgi:hypothetical protein